MLPENLWIAQHPGPVHVSVIMPAGKPEFNCNGQSVNFTLKPTDTVEDLKKMISSANSGMPISKMKINFVNGTFLNKDKFSLAHYNVASGAAFQLGVRERGGRKK